MAAVEVVDHVARAEAHKAIALFQQHQEFCTERERNHKTDHAALCRKLDDLSAQVSTATKRLHARLDETGKEHSSLVNDVGKGAVKQNVLWAIFLSVSTAVATGATVTMVLGA